MENFVVDDKIEARGALGELKEITTARTVSVLRGWFVWLETSLVGYGSYRMIPIP
jgi:hypothetical protein